MLRNPLTTSYPQTQVGGDNATTLATIFLEHQHEVTCSLESDEINSEPMLQLPRWPFFEKTWR